MQGPLTHLEIRFRKLLSQQVDGASLGIFRICFGSIMFCHAVKYLMPQGGISLKDYLYDGVALNFTYPHFEWVTAFAEPLWTLVFVVMGLAALGVALGALYRVSSIALCVSYTYIFLSESAKYNNHYYLMCLLALLLAIMPADRRFSLSTWLSNRKKDTLSSSSKLVPFWTVFLLRFQLLIVYLFGGIAKLNADWLTGIPMLGKGNEVISFWSPILGLPEIDALLVARFICWFGLFYDLAIGFLLLNRRTRLFGLTLTAAFHLSNHFLFPIGLFPAMALTTTLIFLEPDWPVRFARWIRKPFLRKPDKLWSIAGFLACPPVGILLGWRDHKSGYSGETIPLKSLVMGFIISFLLLQSLLPFRHNFIAGDANWTEEGQDFSWRMMLRAKDASHVIFHVVDDEMLTLDEANNMHFNWTLWPQGRPKTLYIPIDCTRFVWDHHKGLTASFEPGSGLRIFYRLEENEDVDEKREELASQWESLFNRSVAIVETLSLTQALDEIEVHLASHSKAQNFAESIARIRSLSSELDNQSPLQKERNFASISGEIESLIRSDESGIILDRVRRLHPFLLQGASFENERFLVVDDRSLTAESSEPEKLTGGQEFLVWMDMGRLRPTEWKALPQWFVTFEDRQLRIVWNYADDLNSIQRKRFSTSPWMIRQFSKHIADQWEEDSKRRPEIRVISNLMMNFRVPQPLVDPTIDMASVEYRFLKHNDWILPLSESVGSATKRRKDTKSP